MNYYNLRVTIIFIIKGNLYHKIFLIKIIIIFNIKTLKKQKYFNKF